MQQVHVIYGDIDVVSYTGLSLTTLICGDIDVISYTGLSRH